MGPSCSPSRTATSTAAAPSTSKARRGDAGRSFLRLQAGVIRARPRLDLSRSPRTKRAATTTAWPGCSTTGATSSTRCMCMNYDAAAARSGREAGRAGRADARRSSSSRCGDEPGRAQLAAPRRTTPSTGSPPASAARRLRLPRQAHRRDARLLRADGEAIRRERADMQAVAEPRRDAAAAARSRRISLLQRAHAHHLRRHAAAGRPRRERAPADGARHRQLPDPPGEATDAVERRWCASSQTADRVTPIAGATQSAVGARRGALVADRSGSRAWGCRRRAVVRSWARAPPTASSSARPASPSTAPPASPTTPPTTARTAKTNASSSRRSTRDSLFAYQMAKAIGTPH